MNGSKKYYGKFRGTVINNVDPLQIGRIQVLVPDVSNIMISSWAMPCLPVTGMQMGMFTVPTIGAGVWVEFEQGDPDYPIWVGGFYGNAGEVPSAAHAIAPGVPGITLQTTLQNSIVVSDMPGPAGGIILKSTTGSMIMVNDTGITITNGKGAIITLVGNAVDVNLSALTIL